MFAYNVYEYLCLYIQKYILYTYVLHVICTIKNITFDISKLNDIGVSSINA